MVGVGGGGNSNSIGNGPGFESPRGIAEEADGSLVVVDTGLECGATGGSYQRRPSDRIDYRQWPITQLANA